MAENIRRELLEVAAQARSLLENLQTLGVREVALPHASGPCPGEEGEQETLEEIRAELQECGRCPLCRGRERIVFGSGNPEARIVFVGEAPGREEDESGEPIVGEAGLLLERILFAMGMRREEVYLCNVEKCRPPGDREPAPEEIAACEPYLKRQISAIKPRLIVALGEVAARTLLQEGAPIGQLRGRWGRYEEIPMMPTYHPVDLLRNPSRKRELWEDMKQVLKHLRHEPEERP